MNGVAAKKEAQKLLRVDKAVSEKAEVIAPFQYYSEVGEIIFALHFSSHQTNAKLYLHFNAQKKRIAQVLVSDEKAAGSDLEEWATAEFDDLAAYESELAGFAELLADMHILASQLPGQQVQHEEVDELLALSRKDPVVIGGCGRSGTTLLLAILGAHPSVLALPEEVYAFYPQPFRLSRLIDAVEDHGSGRTWTRWCEKTPKNVRAFKEINQIFNSEVRLVHMVRDGRDVVTSHHPSDASRYYISPERWVADVSAGLEYGEDAYLLRYETLVQEPKKNLQDLCKFIGEEFDERLLAYEQFSSVRENKAWEARQASPLHPERLERWRAEQHAERVQEFMDYPGAMELMQKLGYE